MPTSIDAGSMRCHVLLDGWQHVSPRFVFKGYADEVQGPFVRPSLDADGKLLGRIAALAIETGQGIVMVDAGLGRQGIAMGAGRVLQELEAVGMEPPDVGAVVVTHGHADHVAGLLDADGSPTFARARHLIHAAEAAFWTSPAAAELPEDAGLPAAAALAALGDAGLLDPVATSVDVTAGVRALEAAGHTPGHLAVLVDDAFLWVGDAVVAPLNVPHPEWVSAADMDGPANEATRRMLLAMAADEGLTVGAVHMRGEMRIRRDGDGFAIDDG